MKILVFGSLNIDYDYHLDHIARPKETIVAKSYEVVPGGKGLNQSIAIAKTGEHVYLAGVMGQNAEILEETLNKYHVDLSYLQKKDIPNGHAIIQLDDSGENSIFIFGGSNQCVEKEYVDEVLSHFEKGDMISLQNEINNLPYIIEQAHEKGMVVLMNPSPCNESIRQLPLDKIDYFFVNEVEGEELTGKKEPLEMLDQFRIIYPEARIILTLGSIGAYYQNKEERLFEPAMKVNAIDTVGAGDTFMGYFISGLANDLSPQECLNLATKASSITVQRKGAAQSIPTIEEIKEIYG